MKNIIDFNIGNYPSCEGCFAKTYMTNIEKLYNNVLNGDVHSHDKLEDLLISQINHFIDHSENDVVSELMGMLNDLVHNRRLMFNMTPFVLYTYNK